MSDAFFMHLSENTYLLIQTNKFLGNSLYIKVITAEIEKLKLTYKKALRWLLTVFNVKQCMNKI